MKKSDIVSAHRRVQMLALMAMLAALQIVLSRFLSINTPINKIGFAFVPIALCAMLFGTLPTVIVAVVADLVGATLFPSGTFFPGFTLTAALTGATYGLLLYKKKSILRVIIAVLFIQLILGLGLNSFWISIMRGTPFVPIAVTRVPQVALLIPVEIIVNSLMIALVPRLRQALPMLAVKPAIVVEPQEVLPETEKEDE